jgi:cytochrome c5
MFRCATLALLVVLAPAPLVAQAPSSAPAGQPAATGKEVLARKCFQCHQASMFISLRQDRKAWEGVLYRMVGRGALWTEAEISAMAEFLATTMGAASSRR